MASQGIDQDGQQMQSQNEVERLLVKVMNLG